MRIRLKGLNCSRKKLANGEITTYWYAWRGGPRLDGRPGSTEFIASYNRAVVELPKAQIGTLDFILDKFQDSDAFLSRALRTQSDYRKLLRTIAMNLAISHSPPWPIERLAAHGMAGRPCKALSQASRLCLERVGTGSVVGA